MRRAASPKTLLLKSMAVAARDLRDKLLARPGDQALSAAHDSLAADLQRDLPPDEAADVLAQAAVCAATILTVRPNQVALDWLGGSLRVWERWSLSRAISLLSQYESKLSPNHCDSAAHLYDEFLHRHSPTSRRRHGVFFTPLPIADYIVRQIDDLLSAEFDLLDGIASRSALRVPRSALALLDPACGTGVFLLAVIDHLHRRLGTAWNDFVPDLLPRLTGIELLPVPAFLAKLNISLKLAATDYTFRQPGQINIRLGDALAPIPQSAIRNSQSAIPIILGNPPFSSLSTNTNPWIARLIRGDDDIRGYVQAGDERLGERKTWLHDDYVKFVRLAQWHIEEAGQGIVGFVTNRGYLDNATFRLMRQELLRVFPHIHLVDLHGSRKGGDVSPDGRPDENVFGLDQGIAIGLFSRPPTPTGRASEEMETRSVSEGDARVEYGELWGARDEKLTALASFSCLPIPDATNPSLTRRARIIAPTAPHWRFVPTTTHTHPEYTAARSLADAMPVNTTAPVTARDHFVVACSPEELHQRIAEFRDLSIPDDVIRKRYFTRTRSSRYQRGDTRSWKLAAARQAVAANEDWQEKIVRCLYRPFDWRWVFWHSAMIDWPRTEVTRHLIPGTGDRVLNERPSVPNPQPPAPLCLIARRQQLPAQPCTFFWISDGLALDGVIRSDNRGSESLFPLWKTGATPEANFNTDFLKQITGSIGCPPEPESVLAYIYALFHSPTYRERYASELRSDFPRILLPGSASLYASLATIGQRLIELHLLYDAEGVGSLWPNSGLQDGGISPAKDSRPLNADACDGFRVGGYVVLKKWLQPRHRSSGDPQYARIATAIDETIVLMAKIDVTIAQHGGFPAAFA